MTLDQRLTQAAHHVVEGLTTPAVDVEVIRARARRDRRRRISLAATGGLMLAIALGTGLATRETRTPEPVGPVPTPTEDTTAPPASDEPGAFPSSMTPEEVVNEPRAQLRTVAVDPGDPDLRLSMWTYQCTRPCAEDRPFEFTGVALTSDGYQTTTYLRPPFPAGVDLQVLTPRDGLFLVSDQSNGGEWLVDAAGTVRTVTRVDQEIRPEDPRLWFQCPARWRSTWCALDPDRATAYKWPLAWDGSAVSPADAERPWGTNPEPRAVSTSGLLEAWWDTDQGRQLETLATVDEGDYVLGSPAGEMAHWARPDGGDTIDIYTSRDGGADWEKDTREAPGLAGYLQLRRTPEGAYLAVSTYPRLVVWRAESGGGAFVQVYAEPGAGAAETSGAGMWAGEDGLLYATANARAVVSDDDGQTWSTVETWRPTD